MQTVVWMAYKDSTYFSDKNSYKIHFISSYGSKDMNYARLTHLEQFSEKKKTEHWAGPEHEWGRTADVARRRREEKF
jgi:hypothetical protein